MSDRDKTRRLPPGPRFPRLFQMFLVMYRPLGYLRYCSRKYGGIFSARSLTAPPLVVLSDPEAIKATFRAGYDQLGSYPANAIFLRLLGEDSFVFQDGDRHRFNRKVVAPHLARNCTPDLTATISCLSREEMAKWPSDTPIHLFHAFRRIAYRSAIRQIVGFRSRTDEDEVCRVMEANRGCLKGPLTLGLFNLGSTSFPKPLRWLSRMWPNAVRTAKLQEKIKHYCAEELDRKLADPPGKVTSYLDAVVKQLDENESEWTRDEILDNLNLLLITGHESASVSSSWLIWELLQHPSLLEQVRTEAAGVAEPFSNATVNTATPLLDAAILESFRLHPPVPVATRSVRRPFQVGDYLLPAGTTVLTCMYLAHRREGLWEDPDDFRPPRFLENKPSQFTYFPFGGGKHRCPGADMGFIQVKCLALTLLRNYEFEFAGKRPPRPKYLIAAIVPDNGVPVTIREKRAAVSPVQPETPVEFSTCPYRESRESAANGAQQAR